MSKIYGYGANTLEVYGWVPNVKPPTEECKRPNLPCNQPTPPCNQPQKSVCDFALPLQFDGLFPVVKDCRTFLQ